MIRLAIDPRPPIGFSVTHNSVDCPENDSRTNQTRPDLSALSAKHCEESCLFVNTLLGQIEMSWHVESARQNQNLRQVAHIPFRKVTSNQGGKLPAEEAKELIISLLRYLQAAPTFNDALQVAPLQMPRRQLLPQE